MALEQFFFENPIPCWVYAESTHKFIIVNKSALTTYGYSEAEFLEELKVDDLHTKEDLKCFRQGEDLDTNRLWHHVDKQGNEFCVRIFSHATLLNGQRCRYVMAVRVNDEAESEQQKQEFFFNEAPRLKIAV